TRPLIWARARSFSASFSSTSPRRDQARGAWMALERGIRGSGNLCALSEARLVPFAGRKDVGEDFGRPNHLDVIIVKRREAEAHQVGCTEVADHAAADERLHDGVALGVRENDVATALGRITRRSERDF